jgi:hypothetical protein
LCRAKLWLVILGLCLWAADAQQAFAQPYGQGTVRDAVLAINKRVPRKKLHKALIGRWTVQPPDETLRQIQILEAALDPKIKRSTFDAMSPTDEEIRIFEAFQTLLKRDETNREILEAKSRVEALNNNQIRFNKSTSVLRVAGAEREQSYRVIGSYPNVLRIFWIEANETNDCVFIDANHLRIFADDQEKVRLERD